MNHRLLFAVHLADHFSLPVVLWTQESYSQWKLRGIAGNISQWLPLRVTELPFVGSASDTTSRHAVDYDRVSGVVYWSQTSAHTSNSWSLGAQPVVDALSWKSTSMMQFLSSWDVGGLAVDWFTGNVYVTETEHQLIAVARYDIHDANMYRVIISSGIQLPTTIALDPYLGSVLERLPSLDLNFTYLRVHHLFSYAVLHIGVKYFGEAMQLSSSSACMQKYFKTIKHYEHRLTTVYCLRCGHIVYDILKVVTSVSFCIRKNYDTVLLTVLVLSKSFIGWCMKATLLDQLETSDDVHPVFNDGRKTCDDRSRSKTEINSPGRTMRRHGPTATLLV